MNLKKNGRINWKDNKHLLYILFSTMKHYMIENDLTDIPCQENDECVKNCASVMSMIVGEEITTGQVGSQLWLQADKPYFSKAHFRNIKIAMEVGLLYEGNFNDVILETKSRMVRNRIAKGK